MNRLKLLMTGCVFFLMVTRLFGGGAQAVYALITRVVVDSVNGTPERIQIWGVFASSTSRRPDEMNHPHRGYYYYSMPTESPVYSQATFRSYILDEWSTIKSFEGTGEVITFLQARYLPASDPFHPGRFRSESEPVANPDKYPAISTPRKLAPSEYYGFVADRLKPLLMSQE